MGTLLALDLGTAVGWAVADTLRQPGGQFRCGTAQLPAYGLSAGGYFASYADWLADMITTYQPDEVAVEQTLATVEDRGQHATESLLGLRALTAVVCYRRSMPLTWHAVSTVRKAVCGSGRAKKDEVNVEAIKRGARPDSHNAADAAAVWFYRAAVLVKKANSRPAQLSGNSG